MRKIKRIFAVLLLFVLFAMIFPSTALAATDFEITSITTSHSSVSIDGGLVNVTYTIKNTGTTTITSIECYFWLHSFTDTRAYSTSIAPGASKTFTDSINFKSNDVNQTVKLTIWNNAPLFDRSKTFKVIGEENVIRSGDVIEPEKDTYFVGETVSITDTMRNSLGTDVTDLKMKYYFRRDGGDTDGDTVTFSTIKPNEKVENTIDYTFTEADIDGLKIGSSVAYYVSGNGPYTEYNVAHDFIVVPAPTPTASPSPTNSSTPEMSPTPTPEQTEMHNSSEVVTLAPDGDSDNDMQKDQSISSTILSDRGLLQTVIILVGVVIILLIVAVIVLLARKK